MLRSALLFWLLSLVAISSSIAQITANPTDSLQLVFFYDALNGPNWPNQSGWKTTAPLQSWFGVRLDSSGRVIALNLPENRLEGELPERIGLLDSLRELDLSKNSIGGILPPRLLSRPNLRLVRLDQNKISGSLPASVLLADSTAIFSFAQNEIDGLPLFVASDTPRLALLDLTNNRLTFDDFRFQTFFAALRYVPQQDFGTPQVVVRVVGGNASLNCSLQEDQTRYQWLKDGSPIAGATQPTLDLRNLSVSDEGFYVCQQTHPQVPVLVLQQASIRLRIDNSAERQSDSLALLDFYAATNGPNWINNTNWISELPLESWQGITITDRRVTRINLNNNQLKGSIPASFGNLTALQDLQLTNNQIAALPLSIGSLQALQSLSINRNRLTQIPPTLGNLGQLRTLDASQNQIAAVPWLLSSTLPALEVVVLTDNEIQEIADLTTHPSLRSLFLSRNRLDFVQVERNLSPNWERYNYSPQKSIGTAAQIVIREGENTRLDAVLQNTAYQYRWLRNGDPLPNDTTPSLVRNPATAADEGVYSCQIRYALIPDLVLTQEPLELIVNTPEEIRQDSLALVAFYAAMSGDNWTNRTHWLSDRPLSQWWGVGTEAGRVVRLHLPNNGLDGVLPPEIGNWTNLQSLDLSQNILRQFLPNTLNQWREVRSIRLSQTRDPQSPNDEQAGLRGPIPSVFRFMPKLQFLDLSGNRFSDLQNLIDLPALQHLNLSDNDFLATASLDALSELPQLRYLNVRQNNFGSLPTFAQLDTLIVDNNRLVFVHLLPNRFIAQFSYAPQARTTERRVFARQPGDGIGLNALLTSEQNQYRWQQNGQTRPETEGELFLRRLQKSDEGVYRCFITNPDLPDLTLETGDFVVFVVSDEDITKERNALRAIYAALDGPNWSANTFWEQTDDFSRWFGVRLNEGGRVRELRLANNRLRGAIPVEIQDLEALEVLQLSNSQITGIPAEALRRLSVLRELYLDGCQLTSLPALTGFPALERLDVQNNALVFKDLLPNVGAASDFRYAPQDSLGSVQIVVATEGEGVLLNTDPILPETTSFAWHKDDQRITGADKSALSIRRAFAEDIGRYNAIQIHRLLPELSLVQQPIFLDVRPVVTSLPPEEDPLRVYPNPVTDGCFRVEVPLSSGKVLDLAFYDALGRHIPLHIEGQTVCLPADLVGGWYILTIRTANHQWRQKVLFFR